MTRIVHRKTRFELIFQEDDSLAVDGLAIVPRSHPLQYGLALETPTGAYGADSMPLKCYRKSHYSLWLSSVVAHAPDLVGFCAMIPSDDHWGAWRL